MKKKYEMPKAEMLEFKYEETVVASPGDGSDDEEEVQVTGHGNGRGHSINSCATGNTADVATGCQPKKWKNQ